MLWGWDLHLCTPTHYPGSSWSPLTWGKSNQGMGPAGTYTKAVCETSPPHCCDLPERMQTSGTRPQSIELHKQTHTHHSILEHLCPWLQGERKAMGTHCTNGAGGLEVSISDQIKHLWQPETDSSTENWRGTKKVKHS